MPGRRAILLILLMSPGMVAAAKCDGAAAAQPVRDLHAKGQLVQALREGEAAAKACPSAATQLALGDVLSELWLRDKAAVAYRRASMVGTPEEKDAAKRGLEALKAAGAPPKLEELAREAGLKQLADAVEGTRLWQRVIAHAEARRLPMTPFVWSGHSAPVDAIAWSGKLIATASRDTTVKLWDADTGRGLATLTGHVDRVAAVALSADAKLVASAGADRSVRVWDAVTARELRAIASAHQNVVSAVAFSPDGKRLASGGWDAQVKLWDVATGSATVTLSGHRDSIARLVWSRDGARLVTIARDGTMRLWEVATGAELKSKLPARDVTDVVLVADGTTLVAQPDGVRRFDEAGRVIKRYSTQPATHVFLEERGRQLAVVGPELTIFDTAKGSVVRVVGGVSGTSVAVPPDLSRIAVAHDTAFVRSFASTERIELGSVAPPVRTLGWIGSTLVIGGKAPVGWDFSTPPAKTQSFVPGIDDDIIARATGGKLSRKNGLRGVALSTDGSQLVTLAVSRAASVARPEAELAAWPIAGGAARVSKRMSTDETGVAVSKPGLVATGGREITLWRIASLQKVRSLPRTESPAMALAFSADGRMLASGHLDGTIAFWDVATGKRRGVLVIGENGRWSYAAEDGRVDGDGDFVSVVVAGIRTPPGVTRARVSALSPLKR